MALTPESITSIKMRMIPPIGYMSAIRGGDKRSQRSNNILQIILKLNTTIYYMYILAHNNYRLGRSPKNTHRVQIYRKRGKRTQTHDMT